MLTKSKFKKALSCPSKLYFAINHYPDGSQVDPFLEALAKGGIQVGELAKLHYPEGQEVLEQTNSKAMAATESYLSEAQDLILFEPAFQVGERLARIDIFVKKGRQVQVIEVKSKSFGKRDSLLVSGPAVKASWFEYVADLAFQRQLVADWFAERGERVEVKGALMLMDKDQTASIDGLNESFKVSQDGHGRTKCTIESTIGQPELMRVVDATEAIEVLEHAPEFASDDSLYGVRSFSEFVTQCEADVKEYLAGGPQRHTALGKRCKGCEFASGRRECMLRAGIAEIDFQRPMAWDIWRFGQTDALFSTGRFFLDQVTPTDLGQGKSTDRQLIQIQGTREGKEQVDAFGLAEALAQLDPPYHFIDFETTAPAIPNYKGLHPYEGMCFQFSHHIVDAEGRVTHANQFLQAESAVNPSFAFIEALYEALGQARGTIFRYATHENTYLNLVWEQLDRSSPFSEARTRELKSFIEDIAHEKGKPKVRTWASTRDMVDLQVIVRDHYWHPRMKGSNSIKDVLPAVIESSELLQQKYSQPLYGSPAMPSKNLASPKVWIDRDPTTGQLRNPYELLPQISHLLPASLDELDRYFDDDILGNGGAAMTAWAYMQHKDMHPDERAALSQALLEYCELDTLAMVFIWERFTEILNQTI